MTSTTPRAADSRARRALRAILVAAAWLALWQALSAAVGSELLLPSPLVTLKRLGELAITADFWQTVAASMGRILLGWLLGAAAGAALALVCSKNAAARAFFSPAMSVIKATPVASFVMLAFVWIRGANLPTFCTFLMVLPVVFTNVLEGLSAADRDLLEMARAFRLKRSAVFRTIRLPALLPHVFDAVRLSLGFAWKAGVAAEVIAHVRHSIGGELYDSKLYLNTADTFAWTAVIILLSVLLEKLCAALMKLAAERLGASSKKEARDD